MESKVKVSSIYNCILERAFKTPILCDISKVHTGYGIMAIVIHYTNDRRWGQVGSTKKKYMLKVFDTKNGFASLNKVIERIENKYYINCSNVCSDIFVKKNNLKWKN